MQRALSRAVAARKRAANKIETLRKARAEHHKDEIEESQRVYQRRSKKVFKDAKLHIKEDWELGPLAPRRGGGVEIKKYGFADYALTEHPRALPFTKSFLKGEQENNFLRNRFVKGDRVVIIKGLGEGQTGKIVDLNFDKQTVEIQGLNTACLFTPSFIISTD